MKLKNSQTTEKQEKVRKPIETHAVLIIGLIQVTAFDISHRTEKLKLIFENSQKIRKSTERDSNLFR